MKTDNLIILFVVGIIVVVSGFAFFTINKNSANTQTVDISKLSANDILDRLGEGPKPGEKVPDFSVQRVDGKTVTLADYEGKPTVVYFWATWCGTCRTSLEELKKVWPEYEGRVNFIGIDLDTEEKLPLIRDFVQKNGYVGDYAEGNEKVLTDYYALMTSSKYITDENAILLDKDAGTFYAGDWRDTFNQMLA